jgi:hypothetical protein
MDNAMVKLIADAIIIDDDTDNDLESTDSPECPPVPPEVLNDVKFPVPS